MAKFYVGQRVRIVKAAKPENHCFIGVETRVCKVVTGKPWADGYCGAGYVLECKPEERKVSANGIILFGHWRSDQLEPIQPQGAAPSEFTTLADLLTSLGAEAKA